MGSVTISILGGMMTVMVTVMIHLDRTQRADMKAGFAHINQRMDQFETRRDRLDTRIDVNRGRR